MLPVDTLAFQKMFHKTIFNKNRLVVIKQIHKCYDVCFLIKEKWMKMPAHGGPLISFNR